MSSALEGVSEQQQMWKTTGEEAWAQQVLDLLWGLNVAGMAVMICSFPLLCQGEAQHSALAYCTESKPVCFDQQVSGLGLSPAWGRAPQGQSRLSGGCPQ